MAEIAVQAVIQLLTPFIIDEVHLMNGLNDDVRIIADVLVSVSTFLDRAEERAIADNEAKHWVRQVRSLAYDIEDVIEEYQLYEKDSAWGKLFKYMSLSVRNMATNVKCIRERAVEIGRARELYKPLSNDNTIEQATIMITTTSAFTMRMSVPESQSVVVGVEVPKRKIFDLLIRRNYHNVRSTLALVGMRGIGKTTLVHCVCNDPIIRDQFPMRAMISMSPTLRRGSVGHNGRAGILRSMMKQFYEADKVNHKLHWIKSLDLASLEHQISECLKETRYLVVFDDAQEGDTEMMNYLKQQVLPSNDKSSKILVTTRDKTVARAWLDTSSDRPYQLKTLTPEKAWMLFCKFQTYEGSMETCPPYLETVARRIVQKCDGLPPAIVAIGRLLSNKSNDLNEWKKVHDNLAYYLQQNSRLTGVYEILTRNYYDVACDLKPCFLYFGVFPKGYVVNKMQLIRLWIAEGFITKNGVNLTLEDIAEENLERLISLSLVEVQDRDPIDQRPKTLRVNEFLHEILISKLDELRFCQILSEKCCSDGDKQPYRRLSIHKLDSVCEVLMNTTKTKPNIRSLFDFDLTQDILAKVVATTLLNINVLLLKVLDLSCAPISDVPLALGNLRNLRYLSLRKTRVEKLPRSIGMLQDLQTLDLKQTKIRVLPNEINKLCKLRHLLIYLYEYDFRVSPHVQKVSGVRIPRGALKNLRKLQKLAYLDLGNGMTKVTHCKELKNLTRLAIIGLKPKDGKDLCDAIQEMKNLQAFTVFAEEENEMLDLDHFVRTSPPPPQMLKRLYINGTLRCFPRWIFDLHNLMKLRLRWSKLNDLEPFDNLGSLPNLLELQLLGAYNGIFLLFKSGGFKKLKILSLLDLHALECLVINEAALPVLEELSIGESPKLQMPYGIQYLQNLKKLTFFHMPLDFTNRMPDVVKHDCDITLRYKFEGGWNN